MERKSPSKPAKIVVAGHICLDIIPSMSGIKGGLTDLLVPGKLVDIGAAFTATGGAVSNTGLALHRLGIPVELMGKVGNDLFGQAILDVLRGYGAELAEGMIVAGGESSSYTLVISPPGIDRIFLHCTGANDTFTSEDLKLDKVAEADLFHFGYPPLMKRMYENGGEQLAALFARVKHLGVTTSLDLARPDPDSPAGQADWRAILSSVLPYVDWFVPSLEEILYMLDRPTYDMLEQTWGAGSMLAHADGALLARLSEELLAMGAAVVGIKLGEQGLYVRTSGEADRLARMGRCAPQSPEAWTGRERLAPCFQVEVAGTTGAGDCTIAGLLAGIAQGLPPDRVWTGAVAAGACNVERPDAISGIPAWSALMRRIEAGWARRPVELPLPGWTWDAAAQLYIGPNDRGHARP